MTSSKFQIDSFLPANSLNRQMISMLAVVPPHIKPHPSPISLGLGEPYHVLQPITSLQVLPKCTKYGGTALVPKTDKNSDIHKNLLYMSQSLYYASMDGLPLLWESVKIFNDLVGNTPSNFPHCYKIHPTFGGVNGFHRVCHVFLEPGDVCIVEEYTCADIIDQINSVEALAVPCKFNLETGIDYDYLSSLLENWSQSPTTSSLEKPKMIYMMPHGLNPTGVSQPFRLKKKIYSLCQQHNLLIIEDDPFSNISHSQHHTTETEYINSLIPSYQTLDQVGRVIRLESFSHTFAPGLQLGFIVAHSRVVELLDVYAEIVNDFPPGPAQALVNNVIQMSYGGWVPWLMLLSNKYHARKIQLVDEINQVITGGQVNLKLFDSQFGVFLGMYGFSNASLFQEKCREQGLLIHVVDSLLINGESIVRLSLGDGTDEEFVEAIERFKSLLLVEAD